MDSAFLALVSAIHSLGPDGALSRRAVIALLRVGVLSLPAPTTSASTVDHFLAAARDEHHLVATIDGGNSLTAAGQAAAEAHQPLVFEAAVRAALGGLLALLPEPLTSDGPRIVRAALAAQLNVTEDALRDKLKAAVALGLVSGDIGVEAPVLLQTLRAAAYCPPPPPPPPPTPLPPPLPALSPPLLPPLLLPPLVPPLLPPPCSKPPKFQQPLAVQVTYYDFLVSYVGDHVRVRQLAVWHSEKGRTLLLNVDELATDLHLRIGPLFQIIHFAATGAAVDPAKRRGRHFGLEGTVSVGRLCWAMWQVLWLCSCSRCQGVGVLERCSAAPHVWCAACFALSRVTGDPHQMRLAAALQPAMCAERFAWLRASLAEAVAAAEDVEREAQVGKLLEIWCDLTPPDAVALLQLVSGGGGGAGDAVPPWPKRRLERLAALPKTTALLWPRRRTVDSERFAEELAVVLERVGMLATKSALQRLLQQWYDAKVTKGGDVPPMGAAHSRLVAAVLQQHVTLVAAQGGLRHRRDLYEAGIDSLLISGEALVEELLPATVPRKAVVPLAVAYGAERWLAALAACRYSGSGAVTVAFCDFALPLHHFSPAQRLIRTLLLRHLQWCQEAQTPAPFCVAVFDSFQKLRSFRRQALPALVLCSSVDFHHVFQRLSVVALLSSVRFSLGSKLSADTFFYDHDTDKFPKKMFRTLLQSHPADHPSLEAAAATAAAAAAASSSSSVAAILDLALQHSDRHFAESCRAAAEQIAHMPLSRRAALGARADAAALPGDDWTDDGLDRFFLRLAAICQHVPAAALGPRWCNFFDMCVTAAFGSNATVTTPLAATTTATTTTTRSPGHKSSILPLARDLLSEHEQFEIALPHSDVPPLAGTRRQLRREAGPREAALLRHFEDFSAVRQAARPQPTGAQFTIPWQTIWRDISNEEARLLDDSWQQQQAAAAHVHGKAADAGTIRADDWQQRAKAAIDRDRSLLVLAPTSAGKSLVALYAIRRALQRRKDGCAVYVVPTRSLVNQVYCDMRENLPEDVAIGAWTAETQLRVYDCNVLVTVAQCFAHVLEARRCGDILYDKVAARLCGVVFDEAHQIDLEDSSDVWEFNFSLLPRDVPFTALSATLHQHERFHDWLQSLRAPLPVELVVSVERPVPLCQWVHDGTSLIPIHPYALLDPRNPERLPHLDRALLKFHKILLGIALARQFGDAELPPQDEQLYVSQFWSPEVLPRQRLAVIAWLASAVQAQLPDTNYLLERTTMSVVETARVLKARGLLPALVFVLDRRQVETLAAYFANCGIDAASTKQHRADIEHAIKQLEQLDRVPLNKQDCVLLRAGIGVHHRGRSEEWKRQVERLFRSGALQLVVATGTLAMGVQMPARTVVIAGDSDFLSRSSFAQMCGRAGRRGLEPMGHVIVCAVSMARLRRFHATPPGTELSGFMVLSATRFMRLVVLQDDPTAHSRAVYALSHSLYAFGSDGRAAEMRCQFAYLFSFLLQNRYLTMTGRARVPQLMPSAHSVTSLEVYDLDPLSMVLAELFRSGHLDRLVREAPDDKLQRQRVMLNLLGHIIEPVSVSHRWAKGAARQRKRDSLLVLDPPPDFLVDTLRRWNADVMTDFQRFARGWVLQHVRGTTLDDDSRLPLSKISFPVDEWTGAGDAIVSPFLLLSGQPQDISPSVHQLRLSLRPSLHLNLDLLPLLFIDSARPRNAYAVDLFTHRSYQRIADENNLAHGELDTLISAHARILRKLARAANSLANSRIIPHRLGNFFHELSRDFAERTRRTEEFTPLDDVIPADDVPGADRQVASNGPSQCVAILLGGGGAAGMLDHLPEPFNAAEWCTTVLCIAGRPSFGNLAEIRDDVFEPLAAIRPSLLQDMCTALFDQMRFERAGSTHHAVFRIRCALLLASLARHQVNITASAQAMLDGWMEQHPSASRATWLIGDSLLAIISPPLRNKWQQHCRALAGDIDGPQWDEKLLQHHLSLAECGEARYYYPYATVRFGRKGDTRNVSARCLDRLVARDANLCILTVGIGTCKCACREEP